MIYFTFFPDYKKKLNINGNALFSEMIYKRYFKKDSDILINTTFINEYLTIIKKLVSYIQVLYFVFFKNQNKIFTVMLDGRGLFIHSFFCYLLSFFCSKIIIYHHSFKYINKKKKILNLLNSKRIIHVAISKLQKKKLSLNYNLKNIVLIESYSIFIKKENITKKNKKKLNIIFFSAINKSKGIYDFFKLVKNINFSSKTNFNIYGNNCSSNLIKKIKKLKQDKYIKEYQFNIGKKNKEKILKKSDILIFPSRHLSESTPAVIDECLNNLVVPISYNIGDVKNQLNNNELIVSNFNQLSKKLSEVIINISKYRKIVDKINKIRKVNAMHYLFKLDKLFEREYKNY